MKFKFNITGLDCPNCAMKLSGMINEKEGISSAKINYITEKLTVESELSESEALNICRACAKAFSSSVKVEK